MAIDKNIIIAVSGVFLNAKLVHDLACTGKIDETLFENYVNSLFIINPINIEDIYNHRTSMTGIGLLKNILLRKVGKIEKYIFYYFHKLMCMEKYLHKNQEMQSFIQKRITQINQQKNYFFQNDNHLLNSILIANLAGIYQDSLGQLSTNIRITGKARHLKAKKNIDNIRVLLFTGVRAAYLWRQLGGKCWHLIIYRNRLLNIINNSFELS